MAKKTRPAESSESPEHPLWRNVAMLEDQGWATTPSEDGATLISRKSIALLSDGVGGEKAGAKATEVFLKSTESRAARTRGKPDMPKILQAVHERVRKLQAEQEEYEGMMAAVAIAQVIREGRRRYLKILTVGDTKVVLVKGAKLVDNTLDYHDQELAAQGVPSELDQREWLVTSENRRYLDAALGTATRLCLFKRYTWENITQGQRLYLYSDGVGDNLTPEQVRDLGYGKTPDDATEAIFTHLDKQLATMLLELCLEDDELKKLKPFFAHLNGKQRAALEPLLRQHLIPHLCQVLEFDDAQALKESFQAFIDGRDQSNREHRFGDLYEWMKNEDYKHFVHMLACFEALPDVARSILVQNMFHVCRANFWAYHKADHRSIAVVDL